MDGEKLESSSDTPQTVRTSILRIQWDNCHQPHKDQEQPVQGGRINKQLTEPAVASQINHL